MVMGMQVPGARVVRTSQRDELPQQWLTDDGRRVLREVRPGNDDGVQQLARGGDDG
ncbi:hypothetical protein PI125_g19350 [Phytophthora idaei]|nr:hypothetical protein PI125_g19350 [Phytophthora idaei]KAG3136391.1 hypothetical protein PI126_g17842 [Phytophthora idaei]